MTTLDDDAEYLRLMYWGPYGSGKTTAAAAAAHLGGVKYIRSDRGIKAAPLRRLGIPTANIEPIDELNPDKLIEMAAQWSASPETVAVVVDTCTEYVNKRIEQRVDVRWSRYRNAQKRRHEEIDPDLRYETDRDDYSYVSQEVRRMMRFFTACDFHLILTGQSRRDVDTDTGHTHYGPSVNPALQGDLVGYMDIVFETDAVEGTDFRLGRPKTGGSHIRKDNLGTMPKVLVSPTFDRVLAYHRGELESKSDPIQEEYREWRAAQKKEDAL